MATVEFDSSFSAADFHQGVVSDFTRRADGYDSGERGTWHHEIIDLILATYPPASPTLDIGCGTGYLAGQVARLGHSATGLDLTPAMLDRARQLHGAAGANFVQGNAERLPFEGGTFSSAYCTCALSYFTDVPGALREARRVLKPGGFLAFESQSVGSFVQGVAFERACAAVLGDKAASVFKVPGHATATAEKTCKLMEDCGFEKVEITKQVEKKEMSYDDLKNMWEGQVSSNAFFLKFRRLPSDTQDAIMKKTIEELEHFRNGASITDTITHWFVRGYKPTGSPS